ncbi:hypothetical protein MK805_17405 [Shimazuella sp. AN120528]|uniref:hypothetical protein n=1 Tax=Shimazuella soli TaxID=1892854 RepID=UPI001F0F59F3|nr:hypothetical protein [Shimazuella soli]MCH5586710.1 hypothetical protein [Shimazuella soli]
MSQANIPNITPIISITPGQTVSLLLSSIALEELALAHLINAEAEKIQFVLGSLETDNEPPDKISIKDLLLLNENVRSVLQDVIKKEMLLQFKFENILELINQTEED